MDFELECLIYDALHFDDDIECAEKEQETDAN